MLVVNYVVHYQMCDECHRREAKDFWRSVVQVRQKVRLLSCVFISFTHSIYVKTSHKVTIMYLEQMILKYKVHVNALQIKECRDGLDFYYDCKQSAHKLVDFLNNNVPCR